MQRLLFNMLLYPVEWNFIFHGIIYFNLKYSRYAKKTYFFYERQTKRLAYIIMNAYRLRRFPLFYIQIF